jgi:hypothetical protein
MLILTISMAAAVLASISLPSLQKQENGPIAYRGLHDRRKAKRPDWKELGYKEYSVTYIY